MDFSYKCYFYNLYEAKMFVEKPKEEVYDVVINEVGSFEITVDVLLVSKCEIVL